MIRMPVMLSVPMPSSVLGARMSSNISDTMVSGLLYLFALCFLSFSFIVAQHSSFVRQSQMPSQASMMNLSSFLRSLVVTSGKALTAYLLGVRLV